MVVAVGVVVVVVGEVEEVAGFGRERNLCGIEESASISASHRMLHRNYCSSVRARDGRIGSQACRFYQGAICFSKRSND